MSKPMSDYWIATSHHVMLDELEGALSFKMF